MNPKLIWLTILLFLLNNVLIWFQLNSQLVWDWAKTSKSMWFMALMGIPISLLFWLATKWGYQGFGNLWSVRMLGFATSMITFPVFTYLLLGELPTTKIIISIILACIILYLNITTSL